MVFSFTLMATFYFFFNQKLYITIILSLLSLWQIITLLRNIFIVQKEIQQFTDAIRYRDLTQHFDVNKAAINVKNLRNNFNIISKEFTKLSKDKELQYQYLQNVLNIIDSGIISYNATTGNILWINSYLKDLLDMPAFKNISFLENKLPLLYKEIENLSSGKNALVNIAVNENTLKIIIAASTFISENEKFKLIAVQNIREVLDVTETEAWNKLLRVLTHEIMNSVAPIHSLSGTLEERIEAIALSEKIPASYIKDIQTAISTIKNRSDGLLRFAESYRSLNKISSLNLSYVLVRDIFESLVTLMEPTFEKKDVELEIVLKDTNIHVYCDKGLTEQALINLLLNALEAVEITENALVTLSAQKNKKDQVEITVADNGKGISKDMTEKIFIPFFSTRKSGNGVGLSLCKQIMLLHKSTVEVNSVIGNGTTFALIFPDKMDN